MNCHKHNLRFLSSILEFISFMQSQFSIYKYKLNTILKSSTIKDKQLKRITCCQCGITSSQQFYNCHIVQVLLFQCCSKITRNRICFRYKNERTESIRRPDFNDEDSPTCWPKKKKNMMRKCLNYM